MRNPGASAAPAAVKGPGSAPGPLPGWLSAGSPRTRGLSVTGLVPEFLEEKCSDSASAVSQRILACGLEQDPSIDGFRSQEALAYPSPSCF